MSAIDEDGAGKGVNPVVKGKEVVTNSGAVYVYTRTPAGWKQQTYLKASNRAEGYLFGNALSLSYDGNLLAVGSIGEASSATGINGNQNDNSMPGAGAVYVFARAGAATAVPSSTPTRSRGTSSGSTSATARSCRARSPSIRR